MNWNLTFADLAQDDPVEQVRAIKGCLEYLADEVEQLDLDDAVILLEAAAEAAEDWLDQRDPLAALSFGDPNISTGD